MKASFEGKTIIVTGGTAGIGKAIAQKFAGSGGRVILVGSNEERGQQAEADLKELTKNDQIHFFAVDVADTPGVEKLIKSILEQFGTVDVLVNNAGITRDQLMLRMSEEDWDRVMGVNVKSCYNFCKFLTRSMMKERKGKIINISSVIGLTGNAGQVNYASSKAAVIGFTKALAKELAPRNICVNCVAPGFIQTKMTEALPDGKKQELLGDIPLGRIGEPEDVANIILFLASPLADYITGQVMSVDGGLVLA